MGEDDCGSQPHVTPQATTRRLMNAVLTEPSSSVSIRSDSQILTPRKQRMKKQLHFLCASKADFMNKQQTGIKDLKAQLRVPKQVINQAIKRKINQGSADCGANSKIMRKSFDKGTCADRD